MREENEGDLLDDLIGGFSPQGWVNQFPGLTPRPQQEIMVEKVCEAFELEQSLLFEAGTGVGKSLVYLLSSILHAQQEKRKAIISTHTIALQKQLRQKDIPLCREILASHKKTAAYAHFKVAFLVGRGNYLCPNRLSAAISNQTELFTNQEQETLHHIFTHLPDLKEGLSSEIIPTPDLEVWEMINADSSSCNRRRCTPENCFYQKAKSIVNAADLVLVNHSLLFSLIQAGASPDDGKGILFPNDFLVLDEAHTVPDIATGLFGMNLSSYGIYRQLQTLYHSRRKKGLFLKYGSTEDMKAVESALLISEEFFEELQYSFFQTKTWTRLRDPYPHEDRLTPALHRVLSRLERVMDKTEGDAPREEIQDQRNRLHSTIVSIEHFLQGEEPNKVHWIELVGKRKRSVAFRTASLNIAPYLRAALFQREVSVLMTSATLAMGDQMKNFKARSGSDSIESAIVNSPFPYEKNLQIFISDTPLPQKEIHRMDHERIAQSIQDIALTGIGGTLILFTSYSDLFAISSLLEQAPLLRDRDILSQGTGVDRMHLIEAFKQNPGSLLLGTESFWTGVDIPGQTLTKLVIPKLPFRNPQDPIPQARQEWLIAQGKQPFADWSLPEALLQFRQGVGRLIRTMEDRGALFLLDSRILHKSYGKRFIEVLPHSKYVKGGSDSLSNSLLTWQAFL